MNETEREEFKKKLEKIRKENLTEQECFDFFGSLNEVEIGSLLGLFSSPDLSEDEKKQGELLKKYLNKLLEKIEEKKQTK